jgi:hypothetical protein
LFGPGFLPKPTHYVPANITDVPSWAYAGVMWTGVATLLILAFFGKLTGRPKTWMGILICVGVVAQTTICMRYGTWTSKSRDSWTMTKMDKQKKIDPGFRGLTGFGMEPAAVSAQMEDSSLDPWLARFWRQSICAKDRKGALAALRTDRNSHEIVVEGCTESRRGTHPPHGTDRLHLTGNTSNRFTFETQSGADGYLSTSFAFSGNWRATVDGTQVPVYRANGYQLAVPVPRGTHQVELRAWSAAFAWGFSISLITLLGAGLYFSTQGRRRSVKIAGIACSLAFPVALAAIVGTSLYGGDNLSTAYSWSSAELPNPLNRAYAKPTMMSSNARPQYPIASYAGRGVDGQSKGKSFSTDHKKTFHWWQVDLGRKYAVEKVVIHGPGGNMATQNRPLVILTSANKKNFVEAATLTTKNGRQPLEVDLERTEARYLRLKTTKTGALSAMEVEVFGQPVVP